jgi:hypothetical protein
MSSAPDTRRRPHRAWLAPGAKRIRRITYAFKRCDENFLELETKQYVQPVLCRRRHSLYSITKDQAAIIHPGYARHHGQSAALPGVFPDYMAPIRRNAPGGARELSMGCCGMPGPPQFRGAPVTTAVGMPL